jgi:hypothetical protein
LRTFGGCDKFIDELPIGISFSLSFASSTENDVNSIMVLGTHVLGGAFTVSGVSFTVAADIYNANGYVSTDQTTETHSISGH